MLHSWLVDFSCVKHTVKDEGNVMLIDSLVKNVVKWNYFVLFVRSAII
jgi:hypothetical protein